MEQRIVSQENNRYIYFIKEEQVGFYLIIPRALDVSLVLTIIDNVNDEVIKQLSCPVGQVYVCPVVSSDMLAGLIQNQVNDYQAVDNIFSSALNLAHQILTYNRLNVSHSVYLKNHSVYTMFCSWFIKKYDGRVLLLNDEQKNLDTNVQESNVTENIVNNVTPVDTPVNDVSNDEVDVTQHGSMGFVSYVLLGVVVAVLSLVFLYFIL